jgi:hypothetical protein
VSATNAARKGISLGSTTQVSGFVHYLTNFWQSGGTTNGWHLGDVSTSSEWCTSNQAGCNWVMYAKR